MCAKLHKNWIKTVGGLAIWKKRFMTDIQTYTSHHKYKVCWLQANNTLHSHFPSCHISHYMVYKSPEGKLW